MNGIGAIKAALESTRQILKMYVDDFTDADLFVRPVPAANHTAWQLGQIITGDVYLVRSGLLPDAAFPELPPGSFELYGKEGAKKDGPDGFLTKAEYPGPVRRRASGDGRRARDVHRDADLDRPTTGRHGRVRRRAR